LGSFAVGGLCSGASIAMALAATHPDDVNALLLHTPFFHPSVIRPTMRAQRALLGSPAGALYDVLRRKPLLSNTYRRFTDGGAGGGRFVPLVLAVVMFPMKVGCVRAWATASNPEASLMSVGSLNAVPRKLMPIGIPRTFAAGTWMIG